MGPVNRDYRENGYAVFSADSGERTLTVKAQREVKGVDVMLPKEASVNWSGMGTVSPRQADDFAALVKEAASFARG